MISSDFRKDAREKLSGKWGKAVCISIVYFAFFFVIELLLDNTKGFANSVVSLLDSLISIPLGFGLIICFIKLFNGENVKAFSFFSFGFDNFGKAWGIALRITLKLILPIILLFVSIALISAGTTYSTTNLNFNSNSAYYLAEFFGILIAIISIIWLIVKSYYYEMANLIAAEKPEISSKEVVEKSKELMQGNRLKLFCLELSFVGWMVLAVLTLGIGMFWLIPYMNFAIIAFYKHLIKE